MNYRNENGGVASSLVGRAVSTNPKVSIDSRLDVEVTLDKKRHSGAIIYCGIYTYVYMSLLLYYY